MNDRTIIHNAIRRVIVTGDASWNRNTQSLFSIHCSNLRDIDLLSRDTENALANTPYTIIHEAITKLIHPRFLVNIADWKDGTPVVGIYQRVIQTLEDYDGQTNLTYCFQHYPARAIYLPLLDEAGQVLAVIEKDHELGSNVANFLSNEFGFRNSAIRDTEIYNHHVFAVATSAQFFAE